MVTKTRLVAYCGLLTAMILWALTFIWYKEAYLYFTPISVVFIRLIIASFLFFGFSKIFKKLQKIDKTDIMLFISLAFFEPFLYFIGEGYGLKYISSTAAAVIVALIPVLTPFSAYFFLKQKIKLLHLISLPISFAGVIMVTISGNSYFHANTLGISLMFVAVFSALGYGVALVRLLKKYNTFTVMTYQNIIAVIYFLPLFLIFDLDDFLTIPMCFNTFAPVFKLAVFGSVIAFGLYTNSVRHTGINIASMFTYLIPAFTAIFAYLLLHDTIVAQSIFGIIVVIAGLTIPQLSNFFYVIRRK